MTAALNLVSEFLRVLVLFVMLLALIGAALMPFLLLWLVMVAH